MCSTPAALALASWCVRNGTPAARTMGFGVWTVSGRSRVPLPPTRRIASVTCRLCFLPGPAELSFGRPVYADRRVAPSTAVRWCAVPLAPLVARRGPAGRAELAVELGAGARRGVAVTVAGDHVQSYVLSLSVEIATARLQICLSTRIGPVETELPGREPRDGPQRGGRGLVGAEAAEDGDPHAVGVEPEGVGAQHGLRHAAG